MNTVEDYQGTLPNGWTGGEAVTKWWRGKHVHLYRLRKPCAQCGAQMEIAVTKAALDGTAKNAGLHLTRCKGCRAAAKALGISSRPKVEGQEPVKPAAPAPEPVTPMPGELETLRATVATMREELEGAHAENRVLRAKLAQYELPGALEAMAAGVRHKMPWES